MAFTEIRVKCKAKALIVICLLLSVERSFQAIRTKPSPCPGIFSYEESDVDDDRWYGDITLKNDKNVEGATLRITLDKPSQLLVSWAGGVFSPDNTVYIASHDEAILYGGTTYKLRIMVKFDKSKAMPSLKTIHFNSRLICPSQNVVDLSYATPSPATIPDLNISDPTDVISDIDRKTTTSRTTARPSREVENKSELDDEEKKDDDQEEMDEENQELTNSTKPSPTRPVTNTNGNRNPTGSTGTPNPINYNERPSNGGQNNEFTGGGYNPNNFNNGGNNHDKVTTSHGNSENSHSNTHDSNQGSSHNGGSGHVPCGTVSIANPLVTHGQKTHHGQWPWHTALYKTEGINLTYLCGGSLVSKNKVITAAHCLVSTPGNKILSYKSLVVYLGKYNLRQYTGETGVQVKEVSRLNVNPTYNSSNYQGDIAILTLSSDVEFTNYVRPVCLWESSNSISEITGKEGVVAGWGLTELDQTSEELKMATLPVVSTEQCLRSYPKFYSEYLGETAFCAGFRNGTSPCNGDSGGGLVFKRNKDTWYLRGIVSLSVAKENLNFCDPNYYVIFTDTARYVDFIRKNVN